MNLLRETLYENFKYIKPTRTEEQIERSLELSGLSKEEIFIKAIKNNYLPLLLFFFLV